MTTPDAKKMVDVRIEPSGAAELTRTQLRALIKKASRRRGIDTEADQPHTALRVPQIRQLRLADESMGRKAVALLQHPDATSVSVDDLAKAAAETFENQPDAEIITRFPALGILAGTRVLAEAGDACTRFVNTRSLKACVGA